MTCQLHLLEVREKMGTNLGIEARGGVGEGTNLGIEARGGVG